MPALKTERWDRLRDQAAALGIEVDGRWSEATLEAKISDMTDETPTPPEPVVEGDEAKTLADLSPAELERVTQALQRKLMAMGEVVDPVWDAATLQAKVEAKQRAKLVNDLRAHGVEPGPDATLDELAEALEQARTPINAPEGVDVVQAGVAEGEGELVTCISKRPVSLGDGQTLGFRQQALVSPATAALMREKDLCL